MTDAPDTRIKEILRQIPLFSFLNEDEFETVARLQTEVSYPKGATICTEGDEGDSFLTVLSGEVEVRTKATGDSVVSRCGPGEFMGEMSLLMGGKRTATLTVSRSTRLLVLDRDTFRTHFLRNAKVLEHLARLLSQRLAKRERGDPGRQTLVIGVIAEPGLVGKSLTANALAGLLQDFAENDVLLLRASGDARTRLGVPRLRALAEEPADALMRQLKRNGNEPSLLEVELDREAGPEQLADAIAMVVAKLADAIRYLVLDLGSHSPVHREATEEVSDIVVEIVARHEPASPAADAGRMRRFRVLNLYNDASTPVPINMCEPFVLPVDAALRNRDAGSALGYLRENGHSGASPPLHRLARKILRGTVGIAIGGGAAFGIAHVGVLRVLEDDGIPVDLLAGTSMGSIIALSYAAGLRAPEMHEIARKIGNVRTTLSALDFTLTKPGLLAGQRMIDIFAPFLKASTFEELTLPCQVVATDIDAGDSVHIGEGRLDEAFRASSSVPMLWSPVARGDRVLVDGAVLDPVPAELVSKMGADICIAVNVVPPVRLGVETVISRIYRQASRLNPLNYLSSRRDLLNTFDVIMNSIQLLQHELGNYKSISADVRIVPDLSAFTWVEFYRAMELIERGAEATQRALPEIRRVLAERKQSLLLP